MGRLQMLEATRSWNAEADTSASAVPRRYVATEAEVDDAFETIRTLRFLQPTPLDGKCAGLVLTAYNAGHSLGGTVWKLRSPSVGTIVMALDWNHHRERHLDGTSLLSVGAAAPLAHAVGRPDVLITDAERGRLSNARRKDRDAALLAQIHATLQSGHSVLIPVDSAARLLELLVLLDQHWAFTYQHQRFPLCLLSHMGSEVVERARTFLEWMSREWAAQLLNEQEQSGRRRGKQSSLKSPLEFPALRHFASVEALHEALTPSQAKVVLATPPAITHGLSRQLLPEFLSDPEALLLLTSRGTPHSLARTLWERWNAAQGDADAWRNGHVGTPAAVGGHLSYELRRRVRLTGDELRAHIEREQAARAAEAQKARTARPQREADDDDSDSESDSDEEMGASGGSVGTGGGNGKGALASTHNIAPEQLESSAPIEVSFDIYLRGQAGSRDEHFRMFPYIERKRRVDGYGETIDTGRWLSRRRRQEAEQAAQLDPTPKRPKVERPAEVPSKFTVEQLSAAVRCHVLYIDMQGLNDGRALKTLVPQLQPRRLILVNGETETNEELETTLGGPDVFFPGVGTSVSVGGLTDSYSVRLEDALMDHLRWSRIEDYNVGYLHAMPDFDADTQVPTLVSEQDSVSQQAQQAPSTLYIGDLRLPALKAYLARRHRIRADFAGEGVLVCGEARGERSTTVTKDADGRIVVEGNLSQGLARVRQSVYDLVAQVHQ